MVFSNPAVSRKALYTTGVLGGGAALGALAAYGKTTYVVAMAVGILLVSVGWRYFAATIALLLLLQPFDLSKQVGDLYVRGSHLIILVAGLLFMLRRLGKEEARGLQISVPAVIFLVLQALLVSVANPSGQQWQYMIDLALAIAGYHLVINADLREQQEIFLGLAIAVAVSSLWGIGQYLFGPDFIPIAVYRQDSLSTFEIGSSVAFRATATFSHSNSFGFYLTMTLPLLLVGYARAKGAVARWAILGAFLLGLVALLLTLSRSAWVTVLVEALLLGAMIVRRRRARTVLIVGALGLAGLGVLELFDSAVSSVLLERIRTLTDASYSSNLDRLILWQAAIRMIVANPLLGAGYGTFAALFDIFNRLGNIQLFNHAHNTYLQVGAETGLLAVGALVAQLVRAIRAPLKSLTSSLRTEPPLAAAALLVAVTGIAVSFMFDYLLWDTRIMFQLWLVLGLCEALSGRREACASDSTPDWRTGRASGDTF